MQKLRKVIIKWPSSIPDTLGFLHCVTGILEVGCQRVNIRSALSGEQDQSQNSNFLKFPMKAVICSDGPSLNLLKHLILI